MKLAVALFAPGALLVGCHGTDPPPRPAATDPARSQKIAAVGGPRCPEWSPPDGKSDYGESHDAPPQIQADMRAIVSASRTVLTIRSLSGPPICVPLQWIDTVEEFYLTDDKRLLDFDHEGFEDYGHFVIDRRSRQAIETGGQPESSDDGTMLIAVPPNRQDDGGIDAIGVWQVLPDRIAERAMLPLPNAQAWRVDRWSGNDCAEISGISAADYWGPDIDGGDSDAAEAKIAKLPRLHFRVRLAAGRWRIEASREDRPCLTLNGVAPRSTETPS